MAVVAMGDKIVSHKGKVVSILKDRLLVEIVSKEACASCSAASLCNTASSKKEISVPVLSTAAYQVGQSVQVCAKRSLALRAVVLAYVLPLFVLLCSVLLFSSFFGELFAGIASVALVLLYFFGLYLFRKQIEGEYVFFIEGDKIKSGL